MLIKKQVELNVLNLILLQQKEVFPFKIIRLLKTMIMSQIMIKIKLSKVLLKIKKDVLREVRKVVKV